MALEDGTTLGPYVIRGALGAGGMGEVYRAHDARLGRDVAVKVLPSAMSRDPERRERFQREARAIAALNHPHICAIHDVGEQDGMDFLVMELLEGESLAARLARGPLPYDDVVPIACAVLDTLAVVHERGIVHRDLKPANIFLTPHGVKLLDFGLARGAEHADTASTAITREDVVLGSPRYMAPEQLRGGAGRSSHRPVCRRCRDLRDARRAAALRRQDHDRAGARDCLRGPGAAAAGHRDRAV